MRTLFKRKVIPSALTDHYENYGGFTGSNFGEAPQINRPESSLVTPSVIIGFFSTGLLLDISWIPSRKIFA